MKRQQVLLTVLIAGSLHLAPAWAAETAVSGSVRYSVKATETQEVSRQQLSGKIEASDPKSVIHGSQQECFGSFVAKDQTIIGRGYCDTVDNDGDVWWLTFNAEAGSSKWTIVGGTGKYEGMTGSGETFFPQTSPVKAAAAAPKEEWVQEYEGTINLRAPQ
jgi:hypothetical protein